MKYNTVTTKSGRHYWKADNGMIYFSDKPNIDNVIVWMGMSPKMRGHVDSLYFNKKA